MARFCESCGGSLTDTAKFCISCGQALDQVSPAEQFQPVVQQPFPLPPPASNEPKNSLAKQTKRRKTIGIIVLVFGVLLLVLLPIEDGITTPTIVKGLISLSVMAIGILMIVVNHKKAKNNGSNQGGQFYG